MNPSSIDLAFKKCKKEKRPALLTYTVSGDPSKKKSLEILKTISKNVDIIELGFAHNTPIADGGEIQNSAYRAIKNGTKLNDTYQIVKKFKKFKDTKPLILMGYWNLILQHGESKFIKNCKQFGVNGLIVVDLPYPENKKFSNKCKRNGIIFVQLLSPTTSHKRMKKIIRNSSMLYYISMLSTTGGKLKLSPKVILKKYKKIKKLAKNKSCVIGFGITSKNISSFKTADGCVVGSEICKKISKSIKSGQNPVTNVGIMVKKLKQKII